MRRTKTKKLEVRQRKISNADPIQELRRLREDELRRAVGGCMEEEIRTGCG